MLPLAIEDAKTRLLLGDGETKQGGQEFKAGLLSMGEDGELKILEMKQEENTQLAVVDDQINTGLIEAFKEDYDALNDLQSDYVRDLVVRHVLPVGVYDGERDRPARRKCEIITSILNFTRRARMTLSRR